MDEMNGWILVSRPQEDGAPYDQTNYALGASNFTNDMSKTTIFDSRDKAIYALERLQYGYPYNWGRKPNSPYKAEIIEVDSEEFVLLQILEAL